MHKKIIWFLPMLLLAANSSFCQQKTEIIKQDSLTLSQCIDIAIKYNPQIKIAEGNYEFSSASLTGTRSPLFPQISFQSGLTRNGGTTYIGPIVREGYYTNYFYGFQAQQLIFDFGKTYSRISAFANLKNSSEQNLISTKQNLILDTEIAYFNYLQAIRVREVSSEVLKQAQEHLAQSEAFYKAGAVAQFDVLKAKTDAANANVILISSKNNVHVCKLQLENILNRRLEDKVKFQDNLELKQDSISLNSAVETAIRTRPEIIAGKYAVDANRALVTSAWTANLPSINATAGYNWRTYAIDVPFQNSWSFGLNLSVPIFQGFALDAGIEQAKANLKTVEASNDALIQDVTLDIQHQYSSLEESRERIAATKALVTQSEETLKLAEGRYKQGVGSAIEITDARVGFYNAQTSYIQSLYDYQVSYARLKRAMGTLNN